MTTSDPVTGQHRAEAWRVGERFGWSCLDCTSGDDGAADATAAERGAEWHSLHPHGLTAPEPVTGATQDPRLQPVAEFVLQQYGSVSGSEVPREGHYLMARRFLAAVDAADAAAGIRRVTADEMATSVKLAQNEVHRLWRMVNAYGGELLCPRCGNGYPGCTDGFPHADTCARYRYDTDTCADCDAQMAAEAKPVGGAS